MSGTYGAWERCPLAGGRRVVPPTPGQGNVTVQAQVTSKAVGRMKGCLPCVLDPAAVAATVPSTTLRETSSAQGTTEELPVVRAKGFLQEQLRQQPMMTTSLPFGRS